MDDASSSNRLIRHLNDRRLMQESARFMEELARYQNDEKHVYESVLSPLNP
jgi:hypothetical protein